MFYQLEYRQPLKKPIIVDSALEGEDIDRIGLVTNWLHARYTQNITEEQECHLPYYWESILIAHFDATPITKPHCKPDIIFDPYPLIACGDALTYAECEQMLRDLENAYGVTEDILVETIDRNRKRVGQYKIVLKDYDDMDSDIPF